jgi:hypothetical protein
MKHLRGQTTRSSTSKEELRAYIFKGWKGKEDSEAPGRMIHSVEHLGNNELDPEALGKTSNVGKHLD